MVTTLPDPALQAGSQVMLVRAGSARHQEPLVSGGHERSASANPLRRSEAVHRLDLGWRSSPALGSNPISRLPLTAAAGGGPCQRGTWPPEDWPRFQSSQGRRRHVGQRWSAPVTAEPWQQPTAGGLTVLRELRGGEVTANLRTTVEVTPPSSG